jgi:hypothetical protein
VPSKADTDSIYNYAELRYLVDRQREITVPIGIVFWSANQGRLWFRLPHEEEQIDSVPPVQARAYAEIVRAKIEGWHQLGELPYQGQPLERLGHAWWEAVRRLLQWRVRLGPVRVVTCCDPEAELERLFQALVQPLSPMAESTAAELADGDRAKETITAD